MDKFYRKSYERPAGRRSLRQAICYYLATVAIDEKKTGVMKVILEGTNNQCEVEFDTEYVRLKQMPNTNRKILRVIDEAGYNSMYPPGKLVPIMDLVR
jgi:hypothetical protein